MRRTLLVHALALCVAALAGSISSPVGAGQATSPAATPTFTKDVAPILFAHCSPCHRPGQTAPFSLLSYADARQHLGLIATVTKSRAMPPWLPEAGYGEFAQDRRLSTGQIDVIQRWVLGGAVEGNPSDLPALPVWSEGWQLGQPDLIVRLPEPYTLSADAVTDVFRNFVVPVPTSSKRYVRAIEFQPGNPKILHHANLGIDRTGRSRRLDDDDPQAGYEGMLAPEVQISPAGHFLGWTPGRAPVVESADMSWPLERGTDLVFQLHMVPTGKAETIQPTVGFFFTDTPPTRRAFLIKLGSKTIDIPAGAKDYVLTDSYTLPVDVDALSVYPHAHYLGKDIKAIATLPDGTTKGLIWIKDWNFTRQDQYQYSQPVFLPKGTVLTMRYTYDNSSENVRNPRRPPAHVIFGPRSSDEMGDLWLQVLPRNKDDIGILTREYRDRELKVDVAWAERMVQLDRGDTSMRNFLGTRYMLVGRLEEAIAQLQETLRLDPEHGEAHTNLGIALQATGRRGEALTHFQQAVRLRPDNDQVHFDLGNALGGSDEAIAEFRRAIALNPDFVEARNNLGVALGSRQRHEEAIRELEQALVLNPDYAEAHNNMAIALASIGRMAEAMAHVRRALEIRPDYPDAQKILALLSSRGTQPPPVSPPRF